MRLDGICYFNCDKKLGGSCCLKDVVYCMMDFLFRSCYGSNDVLNLFSCVYWNIVWLCDLNCVYFV